MNVGAPRHPEAFTMAAFLEGTLESRELATVAAHLRDCAQCRLVVAETARFEREEASVHGKRVPRSGWRWAAAAAAIAAIGITIPLLRDRSNTSSVAALIDRAPREHRLVEPRLAGFPWARLQAPVRGSTAPDPADLKLIGAAGEVLENTAGERGGESLHARGVAYLLIGQTPDSIAALDEATRASNGKQVWSDLAAARYSISEKHPGQLPLALAAADRALKLDPRFAEALFNRALILERMGVRDGARNAWRVYLEADPSSDWSTEARAHLRALEGNRSRFDPKLLDTVPAATLVRTFPQETRTYGEGLLLAEWADAETARDSVRAEARLTLTRRLGSALAAFNGERLLGEAVSAIDAAAGETRAVLANAHRIYRDARIEYNRRNAGTAEPLFRRAGQLFRAGRSPMADVAGYYAASAAFDQNRGAEARDELLAALGRVDGHRARALAAQIRWALAVEANSSGDRGAAIRNAVAAAEIFGVLGERMNAAIVEGIAAHTLELIGNSDLAWSRRIRALDAICDGANRDRCNSLLHDAAATLSSIDRGPAAAALIDITIDSAPSENAALLASALMKRARVAARGKDFARARLSLQEATTAAARITDPSLREMVGAQITIEESAVAPDPRAAIAALDRALKFLLDREARHLLPHAHLQQARAFRSAGETARARSAYASVLRDVEVQQATIGDANARLAFLDTATEAIEESIDLDLAHGDVTAAFATADRRQVLLYERGRPAVRVAAARRLPADTAVIEYVVLPEKIVMFFLANDRVEVAVAIVGRDELAARVASFAENVRRRGRTEPDAAALFAWLIAPLRSRLSSIREVVFVPDRQLYAVPFAALYDRKTKRYLIEDFTIRFAPAASAAVAEMNAVLTPALVVADPPREELPGLEGSRNEAELIASLHDATLLMGAAATRARFAEAAGRSALIHFAGHADSDAAASYGALLLAADANDSGILATADIAQLALGARPLVVLAACGTFRGDPIHASGMSSLARAFLIAGARGVVGTLWEIDDDSAGALFLRFHQSLRAGASPARALRDAQLALLHSADRRSSAPAAWAPIAVLTNN